METLTETKHIARYESYKDSGVEWLGDIPECWELKPGFTAIEERSEKNVGLKENTVLSLSYGKVVIKPEEKLTGLVPESFETYQLVYPGDIIIRPTDLQNDKTSLRTGLALDKGIITSAYINLKVKMGNSPKFFYYLFHTIDTTKMIYGLGSGLRQNLSFGDFKRFKIVIPPTAEQIRIAEFLDRKTAQIDKAIAIKEKQIELLKERRQILIHKAVTRGLNPNVPMKDSGVEWIGEIPAHWEAKRLKLVANLISEKVLSKNCPDRYIGMENIESGTGNLIETESEVEGLANRFEKGDLLFGKLRPYLAKAFLADFRGICSTEFLVYRTSIQMTNGFFLRVLLSNGFIRIIDASTYGSKMPRANADFIGNQTIPIPPLGEQDQINSQIEELSRKGEAVILCKEKEIEKLKEYKASLVNGAVTGKIKVG